MRVAPASCCKTIWVLRAMRAEKSVGSASASSSALVCSDWVWPWVAAIASIMVRDDIVEHVLRGQRPARGLAMRAQRQRARILRLERLHQLGPDHARGAQLGDLHEIVHADRPEERHARRELIDGEPGLHAGAHIFDAVGERIGELEVLRRAGFLHVIAGNRNRIELRHFGRGVGEDVGDDAQARRRADRCRCCAP